MTPQAMAAALYKYYGRWQRVANACSNHGAAYHSAGYYQQIATGRIKTPDAATAEAINRVASAETPLKCPRPREARYSLTVQRSRGLAVNQWRICHELEWDEWMERAQELMEAEYGS